MRWSDLSHALRVRGLKPITFACLNGMIAVARSTRAWIETRRDGQDATIGASHALRVRGLKLRVARRPPRVRMSHALRVRGLKLRT